jgi:HEAT repeat protein
MKTQTTLAVLCLMTILAGAFAQQSVLQGPREAIRQSFPDTFDRIADIYDSSAVPELLDMLNSEDDEEYWPRVVAVLGVVGDEEIVDVLIEVIEKPIVGPIYISRTQHDTRREAIRVMGFLAARTGGERALDYLIESLDDTIWRRRNIQGVVSYLDAYDRYDRHLSIHAIFGLALSGHPRAGEALRSLHQSPTPEQALLRRELDGVLDTWLEVHDLVAERGVAGMYEYLRAEHARRLEAEIELLRDPEEARRRLQMPTQSR